MNTTQEALEAVEREASDRYNSDPEFHTIVYQAVEATLTHPYISFTSEALKEFMRDRMVKAASLALVLQEHIDDD